MGGIRKAVSKESVKDRSQPSNGCMVLAHFFNCCCHTFFVKFLHSYIWCVFKPLCPHMFYNFCIFCRVLSHAFSIFTIFNLFRPSLSSSHFFTDLHMVFTIFDPFIFFTVILYFSTFFFVALVQMVLLF